MSLIQKLYQHRRDRSLENYFTQIVAHLFECNPDLLKSWLCSFQVNPRLELDQNTTFEINPQIRFTNCRPDIGILASSRDGLDVIFVESKVEASEKNNQLSAYAQVLKDDYGHVRRRILVYITKYFDPKDKKLVLGDAAGKVEFVQLRWYDFFHLLKKQPHDLLIAEAISFMEEIGLDQSNQFAAHDVQTMAGLINLYSLMDTSLADDVELKFQAAAREKFIKGPSLNRDFAFYILETKLTDKSIRWIGLGFQLGNQVEAPEAAVIFQVNPYSRQKTKFLPAMKTLEEKFGWEIRCWDGDSKTEESGDWIEVACTRKLEEFLPDEDNLNLVKKFFLDRMDELDQVQMRFPRLPWGR